MHNRPYVFTKHCIEKIELAQFIDESRIAKINATTFSVKNLQNNVKSYKVILKNENGFPSCGCEDWKRTILPYKHMFALFNGKTGLNWNAFRESYRNSPFFSLDIIKSNNTETSASGAVSDLSMEDEIYEENNHVNFNPLQKKQYSKKSKASMCRELLKQIRSLTFLIQDNNVFDKLEEDLRDILEDLKLNAPTENGLVKETLSSVRSSPKKGIFRYCLPKPRQRKSSLTGRVGIGAEKR